MTREEDVRHGSFSPAGGSHASPAGGAGMLRDLEALLNRSAARSGAAAPGSANGAGDYAEVARRRLAERRQRERIFGTAAADPAWDILLELFIAGQEEREVSLETAAAAAGVPATTTLRWIAHIAEAGLVEQRPDRTDSGRKGLRLSPLGMARMLEYFRKTSPGEDRTSA